jgi:hypothetical protein
LAIVEPINEPAYFKHQNIKEFTKCNAVYRDWLERTKAGHRDNFLAFRYENTKRYINRMVSSSGREGISTHGLVSRMAAGDRMDG